MPTGMKGNSQAPAEVPLPTSFELQRRDPQNPTAWVQLDDPAQRGVTPPPDRAEALFALARTNIIARQVRKRHLPSPMFGEPAWDMLLSLYVANASGPRLTVSNLSDTSGAPPSTALRWIDYLEHHKYVVRAPSATDRRVIYVDMTDTARLAIEAYLFDLMAEGIAVPR